VAISNANIVLRTNLSENIAASIIKVDVKNSKLIKNLAKGGVMSKRRTSCFAGLKYRSVQIFSWTWKSEP
jgi:hypothetical protein